MNRKPIPQWDPAGIGPISPRSSQLTGVDIEASAIVRRQPPFATSVAISHGML